MPLDPDKLSRMVNTTEKIVGRMDAYEQRRDEDKKESERLRFKSLEVKSPGQRRREEREKEEAGRKDAGYGHPVTERTRVQQQDFGREDADDRSKSELLEEAEHAHKTGEKAKDRESAQKWFQKSAELKKLAASK